MTVTTADANDAWRFDDLMKRAAQALFAESEDPKLNERRALYRLGLLEMAAGLAKDSFLDYDLGARHIERAFHTMIKWNVPPPEPILAEAKIVTHDEETIEWSEPQDPNRYDVIS